MTLSTDKSRCEGSFPSGADCSKRDRCARYVERHDKEPLWRAMYLCGELSGDYARHIPVGDGDVVRKAGDEAGVG
jgi:hypothetical protein